MSAGRWPEVGAWARSREDFFSLLPQGLATPDNRLLEILDEDDGAVVGFVWYAIQRKRGSCSAYVFDLEVKPEHRRKGHALRALRALELDAVAIGAGSIGLNVFANNLGAQELYRKLGYAPTNFNMRKPLPAIPGEGILPVKTQARDQLLRSLRSRFEKNMDRHKGLEWATVLARLETNMAALASLAAMEASGGEPDLTGRDKATGQLVFCDCSVESPSGRRSLCFDAEALNARKENKPAGSALEAAAAMGIELLTEEQYRALQQLGEFDSKTSSWIATPAEIRSLGGALFCDRRYGKVFVYHNGAQSYYAARGFRGLLRV